MTAIESRLHRTWIQMLMDAGYREIASMIIDANLVVGYSGFYPNSIIIEIPNYAVGYIGDNQQIRHVITQSVASITKGHIYDQTGYPVNDLPIEFRVKLLEVEEDWKDVVRNLIVQSAEPNQAMVTEKQFSREHRQPLQYNAMKFPSHAHVRIAQELEQRGLLFFPLPLAVRNDTGNFYQDHREIDFVVCVHGTWGILEIALHADRVQEEHEKDAWLAQSGIRHVWRYGAEECFARPAEVIDKFLATLQSKS